MILLGLNGQKGSGKDTAFLAIRDWCQERGDLASRRGFADKLKISAARALGLGGPDDALISIMDAVKLTGNINYTMSNPRTGKPFAASITGREFLQRYGTESHRDVFGDDFWVDSLLPMQKNRSGKIVTDWPSNFDEGAVLAVVTDVRFHNEARRVRELGGMIWRVSRPGLPGGDGHSSEIPLDDQLIDVELDNSGSRTDFMKLVAREAESSLAVLLES